MAKNAPNAHVLVVDDESRLVTLVRKNLESMGYKVSTAADGKTAISLLELEDFDLVILDLMLPDIDGYDVCRQIREFSNVPIIILTARSDETEKVRGLDLGADDYLTKPFHAQEMLARVRAVLRRTRLPQQAKKQPILAVGDLCIDFARRQVTVRGARVKLSPTEYKLLYELATNAGRVLLHDELLRRVWGSEYRDEVEYLRVYIRYLRQKLEEDPARPRYILTEPGVGYCFALPVGQ
ncbi:MAG: response regulator transcription factor [Chloroflexota bacterium]